MQVSASSSERLWNRARSVLPGGVSSNIKMEERPHPMFFIHAEGSRLFDCDGNAYIDYSCGYGSVILGHGHPSVVAALQGAAARGFNYGGQHEGEVILAEKLVSLVPCIEMVRYNSTGSEAVAAAIRLARAYTGRPKFIRFSGHYHGWLDEQLVSAHFPVDEKATPRLESAGQCSSSADNVLVAPWNDASALECLLEAHSREVAAVLMEPIMCNGGVIMPVEGYLERARELCTRHGVLLIFDEVITGFRVHLGGAQALLGVTPDLAVFGKAMANGFPISCVGGRREIMNQIAAGRVFHAGTFNGNPLGVATALATVEELSRDNGAAYQLLTAIGRRLMQGIREAAAAKGVPVLVQGPGPVFYTWFTQVESIWNYEISVRISRAPYSQFAAALLANGVRVIPGGRWYVTCSHTEEDVDRTCEAVERALEVVRVTGIGPVLEVVSGGGS
ncbi:MAG: aspartate aminotransferase family protein [Armatimonadota bacterium]|nr:aspartate aminotransferase family protein [Armatimonadota bacterium]